MSDLQCPATLLVTGPGESEDGALSAQGREEARTLAGEVRGARLAMIYTSSSTPAAQTADIVAAEVGVPVRVHEGLRRAELAPLADLHRGETVLVVGERPPALGMVEVCVDSDGWTVRPRRRAAAQ